MAFDFSAEYVLEDESVLLRPLRREDYEVFLPFAVQEPGLWKHSVIPASGEKGMRNYIETALEGKAAKTEYPFSVFDKPSGRYAGSTRFYDIQLANNSVQLGYTWYGQAFQGTGLNKRCKYLLLQFAFGTMEAERVEFRANNRNERSIAAMKSIGCVEEGVLRRNVRNHDGSRRDSIVLSILKDEWIGGVRDILYRKICEKAAFKPEL